MGLEEDDKDSCTVALPINRNEVSSSHVVKLLKIEVGNSV